MGNYIFYAGRVHHYLKLEPLRKYFEDNGHTATWVTSNNAINIDPNSEYLVKYGANYKHVFDYCEPNDVAKWLTLYRETLSLLDSRNIVDKVAPFWLTYSLRETSQLLTLYPKMLKDIDGVFVLHTNNFFTKPLAHVAKQMNIPVYAFQEGLLRDRDQETLNKQSYAADYCTKLFAWSGKAKSQYLNSGIDESLLSVTGAVHLDQFTNENVLERRAEYKKKFKIHPGVAVVSYMLPFLAEYAGNVWDDVHKLKEFCSKVGIALIVRPHPMNSSFRIDGMKTDYNPDVLPLILASDLVLGQHSTIMAEAPALGTMFAEYSTEDVLESPGIFPKIHSDNLQEIVNILQGKMEFDIVTANQWVNDNIGPRDGLARQRILDIVTHEN